MSTDTKYNGWTNRETWLYGLWFDRDYDAELAQECWNVSATGDPFFSQEERARLRLADSLKQNFEDYLEQMDVPTSGIIADLLQGAVDAINWHEIADNLLADVDKSEPA